MNAEFSLLMNMVVCTPHGDERIVVAACLDPHGEIWVYHVHPQKGNIWKDRLTDVRMSVSEPEQGPATPEYPKGPPTA